MLQLINYSEKAVALVGDTREIKDELKALGGRFNDKLSCGAGWIFSQTKKPQLEALMNRKPEDHKLRGELNHPAVYCGTYGKYASGSIKGAWVDLTTFASGRDAVKWMCEVLHKDERDPELMMQDFQDFPEWMYAECMGAAQIDEILEWWKKEGCKPKKADKSIDKELLEELRKECEKAGFDADYRCKEASTIVRLEDGRLIVWDKPSIETRFCFGYSNCGQGPSNKEAHEAADNARTKEYFMAENLADINKALQRLDSKEWEPQVVAPYYKSDKICAVTWERRWEVADADILSEELKGRIREALTKEKEKLTKMLEAWWKRYGAEKLTVWTYWMDD